MTNDFVSHNSAAEADVSAEAAGQDGAILARILWPALGFPAVITPQLATATSSPLSDSNASRCICVLLLSNRKFLGKEDVAPYLRYVPWAERGRRHLPDGQTGAFDVFDIAVRNDAGQPSLVLPKSKDRHGEMIVFGGDKNGAGSIIVTLANHVRDFYREHGLKYLHEIRISEAFSKTLPEGQYHLFWNNRSTVENAPSDELQLLLREHARPLREKLPGELQAHQDYWMAEYEYEFGLLHAPYKSALGMRKPRNEILHPVFIQKQSPREITISHLTDMHVHVRVDVYEERLKKRTFPSQDNKRSIEVSFDNWNKAFQRIYADARQKSQILLLTGDLIDYGRGYLGLPNQEQMGQDDAYHVDRNWFLFYYFLASGENYQRPVYTILGNHDWRLNPYPPFAPGAPSPKNFINNYGDYSNDTLKSIIRQAHGPGHERKLSYYGETEDEFTKLMLANGGLLKGLRALVTNGGSIDIPHTPAETRVESVAWYLFTINPFLDYAFSLPGGYQILMLDWGEDENVLFPIIYHGQEWPYMLWQLEKAADPGPKTANSLTALQKKLISAFLEQRSPAKIIGIHAPPIGPYSSWSDHDLYQGKKTYKNPRAADGPVHYATKRDDGSEVPLNGHPFFALSRPNEKGSTADYGSLGPNRDWFIQEIGKPASSVRLVLSGHIHRSNLLVVHTPGNAHSPGSVANLPQVKAVVPQAVRSAKPPAVAVTPEGRNGPLYVNTTSAGPRGNSYPREGQDAKVDPGYALINLTATGVINWVKFL
jgi:hypothetical protein